VAPDLSAARRVLERAVAARAFPAAVVEVGGANQVLWRQSFGRLSFDPSAAAASDDTIFDLASLTKTLAAAPLAMRAFERGALDLDEPVQQHIHRWPHPEVTVRDLLAHCSGLPAYAPLFERCSGRDQFERAICATPLAYRPRTSSSYSDLGFILLGFILEQPFPLPVQFDTLREQMGGIQEIQFHPPPIWRRRTAPTRQDPWRGRLLLGEVDDNNAYALGGAAAHAGLFGTAGAVGECARHLLQVLSGRVGAFSEETLRLFIERRHDVPGSSRALAWDTMLPTSSCGTRMSPRAFGHTGFTGTSLWIDPDAGIYVVLLTNRVHPASDNESIKQVRPALHDAVMEAVQRS
jgi:CubicO group peptidase (beta-lactamase class C family)